MKPGIKQIISAAVLLILGTCVVPLMFLLPLIRKDAAEIQFKVPGAGETTVEKTGRYYLWNNLNTVFEGKSYNRSKSLPDGMEIRINDANGDPLQFSTDTSISSRVNGHAKQSIGYVEIVSPGQVKIEVTGGNEERIVSFSQFSFRRMFGAIFAGVGVAALFVLSGLGLLVWGIIKLSTRR